MRVASTYSTVVQRANELGCAWPVYDRHDPFWVYFFNLTDAPTRHPECEDRHSACIYWVGRRASYNISNPTSNTKRVVLDEQRDNGSLIFNMCGVRYQARTLLYATLAQQNALPHHPSGEMFKQGQNTQLKNLCKNYHCVNPHHHVYVPREHVQRQRNKRKRQDVFDIAGMISDNTLSNDVDPQSTTKRQKLEDGNVSKGD